MSDDAVWLAHGEEVSRIDAETGRILATVPAGGSWTSAIASGGDAVWVAENDRLKVRRPRGGSGVAKIDPKTAAVVERIPVPGLRSPTTGAWLPSGALAAGEGALWAAAAADHAVWRIDGTDGRVARTIQAGRTPGSVAVGEGGVWVEHHADETVTRIDPFSNDVVETIEIGRPTRGVAAGEGAIWISVVR